MAHKDEYPPLLQAGLHKMSLGELKALVVDAFPKSQVRAELWKNFITLFDRIKNSGLKGELWIDGSFLTEKTDPGDVDFVLDVPLDLLDKPTIPQRELLEKLSAREFRKPERLHSFVMFTAPSTDPKYQVSLDLHAQWQKDFGFSYVTKEPKGIAVVAVSP